MERQKNGHRRSIFDKKVLDQVSFIIYAFKDLKPITLAKTKIRCQKNVRTKVALDFTSDEYSAPMAIEKIKILGALLELPAKQHCRFGQFGPVLR